jgi:hypothetical protein
MHGVTNQAQQANHFEANQVSKYINQSRAKQNKAKQRISEILP